MSPFAIGTLVGWASLLASAAILRGWPYSIFAGVVIGVYSLSAVGMAPLLGSAQPIAAVLHVLVYLHFFALLRPAMRPPVWRWLVSYPASYFAAATLLGLPWAVAHALGFHPWVPWLPFAAAFGGFVQSLSSRREEVDLTLGGEMVERLQPYPHGSPSAQRPLRVVQISDPHLGPFMSVARLRAICERAVQRDPDLIALTGDFLTMESQQDAAALTAALAPLLALKGRVFACMGNHDHEAPTVVRQALASAGVRLLVDEAVTVETPAGVVQIVGADFVFRDRGRHLAGLYARTPRIPGALRLVLLHDPGAFRHLPAGEGDLVLSGHTHGGQVGLLSLGASWTFLRLFGLTIPDHGFWARGLDRLYVHRGTGHYGFPLRVGVPAEESVLRVHRPHGLP